MSANRNNQNVLNPNPLFMTEYQTTQAWSAFLLDKHNEMHHESPSTYSRGQSEINMDRNAREMFCLCCFVYTVLFKWCRPAFIMWEIWQDACIYLIFSMWSFKLLHLGDMLCTAVDVEKKKKKNNWTESASVCSRGSSRHSQSLHNVYNKDSFFYFPDTSRYSTVQRFKPLRCYYSENLRF